LPPLTPPTAHSLSSALFSAAMTTMRARTARLRRGLHHSLFDGVRVGPSAPTQADQPLAALSGDRVNSSAFLRSRSRGSFDIPHFKGSRECCPFDYKHPISLYIFSSRRSSYLHPAAQAGFTGALSGTFPPAEGLNAESTACLRGSNELARACSRGSCHPFQHRNESSIRWGIGDPPFGIE